MARLTEEQVDDLVDEWHHGSSSQKIWEFLEFTFDEFKDWVRFDVIPEMDERRYLKALAKL